MHERATKDSELLSNRLLKLQGDFDMQLSAGEQLAQENNQKNIELRVKYYTISAINFIDLFCDDINPSSCPNIILWIISGNLSRLATKIFSDHYT